jgi:TRAP-type C4-dicarboxylate transport system permease small subunit
VSIGGVLKRLDRLGRRVEDVLLAALLSMMILLAGWQIVQRNFVGGGLIWTDELLRLLVLWLGLLGAMAASRDDRHVAIDLLLRFLPKKLKPQVQIVLHLFTATVCGLLSFYSFKFVLMERDYQTEVLTGLPAWWFELILPLGFGMMCLRYLGHLRRTAYPLPEEVA